MLEWTKRISFIIRLIPKVEPRHELEPVLHTGSGSDQMSRLRNTACI